MKTLSQYLAIAMMVILVATGAWAEPINCTYVPQFGAGSISRYPDEPVVCAGSTVTFTATIPTDNDTCDDDRKLYEDTVSVSWNFGDGNTGSGTPIEHQFTNDSGSNITYTVTATFDDGGNPANDPESKTATLSVTVYPSYYTATLSGSTDPTRGTSVTYAVTTTPAMPNPIYKWRFQGDDGAVITGPNPSGATWGGTMVKSGYISCAVIGSCAAATAKMRIGVVPRNWSDTRPEQTSNGGNGPLARPPKSDGDLGETVFPTEPVPDGAISSISGGPNTGYNYVESLSITWAPVAHINSDIHYASVFGQHQCPPTYLSIAHLLENVRVHEGVDAMLGYTSHWGNARDYLDAHPIIPTVEPEVVHSSVETAQDFKARIENTLGSAVDAVLDAYRPHPPNVYQGGSNFDSDGDGVYNPPCP